MIVGFTGTSQGMTLAQRTTLWGQLCSIGPGVTFLHGDCVGADADAHMLAAARGWAIETYPCDIASMRAYCASPWPSVVHPVRRPLVRNKIIAERCELLLATPAEPYEVLRSGTWATIRAARKLGRPGWIILPDGGMRNLAV